MRQLLIIPVLLLLLLFLSGCFVTEVEPCNSRCEYEQQLKQMKAEKNVMNQELASWRNRFLKCRKKGPTALDRKVLCPQADMMVYDCHPMKMDSSDWNVAVKWGMPGDKVEPYHCSSIDGSPINKYPFWYRKLWHEWGNKCIMRVQQLVEEPNGNLGYGAHGVDEVIKWKSASNKRAWTPKRIKKPSTI